MLDDTFLECFIKERDLREKDFIKFFYDYGYDCDIYF